MSKSGKITKAQLKVHRQAEELLWGSDKKLSHDDILFCLQNWDPRALAGKHVVHNQAYFTPYEMALSATLGVGGNGRRVVDIGAGIGMLAYCVLARNLWDPREVQVTAVELNHEYVRVGRRLLPEVEWIQGSFYDLRLWQGLDDFAEAVSNPPFGTLTATHDPDWIGYKGPAGLQVAAIGIRVARIGVRLILPQTYTPFRYSDRGGHSAYEPELPSDRYGKELARFMKSFPDCEWWHSSIDTALYRSQWRGANPVTEIAQVSNQGAEMMVTRSSQKKATPSRFVPPIGVIAPPVTRPIYHLPFTHH